MGKIPMFIMEHVKQFSGTAPNDDINPSPKMFFSSQKHFKTNIYLDIYFFIFGYDREGPVLRVVLHVFPIPTT